MRTLLLSMLMIAVIGCSDDDCDDDDGSPTGPDTSSTGVIYGTVALYDQHLRPRNDHSGAVVRYVNTEGRTYTATTNPAGEWNLELPFGTYYIDTIYHPTLQMFAMGYNPFSGPVSPLDWFGRGRRQIMMDTKFTPSTLDSVAAISNITARDTSSSGQQYLIVNFTTTCWFFGNFRADLTLTRADGSEVATTQAWFSAGQGKPHTEQKYLITGLPEGTSVHGMKLTITLSTEYNVEQMHSTTEGQYGVTISKITPRNSVAHVIL